MEQSEDLAYIIGAALGDGNLSCPNGRAIRLRITCDAKYPDLIKNITHTLRQLFPKNKVSHIMRADHCIDISLYSNKLNLCMPWKVGHGSKYNQRARVPNWIQKDNKFMKTCLRGLIQTDGSIYTDRTYKMVNFNNITEDLADDVLNMMVQLGFSPKKYEAIQKDKKVKYSIRLSRDVASFLNQISLYKS